MDSRHTRTEPWRQTDTMVSAEEVWSMIKKKDEELGEAKQELKSVQQEIDKELKKPQAEQDAGKLASLQGDKAYLRQQWNALHSELENFQKQHALLTPGRTNRVGVLQ